MSNQSNKLLLMRKPSNNNFNKKAVYINKKRQI